MNVQASWGHLNPVWGVFAISAIGLFLLALVVLGSVLLAARHRRFNRAKLALAFVAGLWLLPVIGILGLVAFRAVVVVNDDRAFDQSSQVQAARGAAVRGVQERGLRMDYRGRSTGDSSSSIVQVVVAPASPGSADVKPVEQPITKSIAGDAKLPDWVAEKDMSVNDKRLIVLRSEQFATAQEADNQVMRQARTIVVDEMRKAYNYAGAPPVSDRDIETRAYGRRHVEQIDRVSGANTFTVYRVYRQLQLSPALYSSLEPQWREQIAAKRLGVLGMLAGLMTLTVATAAAYLRINARTKSAYRRRLRLAAVCFIGAIGLAAMSVIG